MLRPGKTQPDKEGNCGLNKDKKLKGWGQNGYIRKYIRTQSHTICRHKIKSKHNKKMGRL
jgi:hypothetical protein